MSIPELETTMAWWLGMISDNGTDFLMARVLILMFQIYDLVGFNFVYYLYPVLV